MAHLESVEAYLEGKGPAGVALFRAFQELVERFGPAEVAPSCSIVYWKRKRIFAGAWVERTRFELNGDLVRDAEHPCKLAAFPLTKRVITHRLRVTAAAQLDDALSALGAEAYEQVGPGTCGLASRRP
jgi:hypothetical protein